MIFPILAIAIIMIIVVVLATSKKSESYPASYAYQFNVQPFYLSPQSTKLWMNPATKLCKDRATSECKNLPYEQRIACVQQALQSCMQSNAQRISKECVANIPTTICKHQCKDPSKCTQCSQYVQAFGVCSKPDLMM